VLCKVLGSCEGQYVGVETFKIGDVEDPSLTVSSWQKRHYRQGHEELDADLQRDVPDVVKKQLRAVALLR